MLFVIRIQVPSLWLFLVEVEDEVEIDMVEVDVANFVVIAKYFLLTCYDRVIFLRACPIYISSIPIWLLVAEAEDQVEIDMVVVDVDVQQFIVIACYKVVSIDLL